MHKRVIIADTSCLIALKNIGQLNLLQKVYHKVLITPEVQVEFGEEPPDWIQVESVKDKTRITILELKLDKGESSAIALAIEQHNSLLIIDERKGRRIAKQLGIKITGILGVFVKAKMEDKVSKIKPLIQQLENNGFRISPVLKKQILTKVNES